MLTEKELILKLFYTDHLNVPERARLPGGVVRASVAREVVNEGINSSGWFPGSHQFPIGDDGGEYFQLELISEKEVLMLHNFEASFLKFEHKCSKFFNIEIAIDEYLKLKEREGLDGLQLDCVKIGDAHKIITFILN